MKFDVNFNPFIEGLADDIFLTLLFFGLSSNTFIN